MSVLLPLEHMSLIYKHDDLCNELNGILFPDGSKSVNNLSCDELNEEIESFITSKIHREMIMECIAYITQNYSDSAISLDSYLSTPIHNIIEKIVSIYDQICWNIQNRGALL